jgi:hypothetical protein
VNAAGILAEAEEFKNAFGMSLADFYIEFEKFSDLPLAEQMKIVSTN